RYAIRRCEKPSNEIKSLKPRSGDYHGWEIEPCQDGEVWRELRDVIRFVENSEIVFGSPNLTGTVTQPFDQTVWGVRQELRLEAGHIDDVVTLATTLDLEIGTFARKTDVARVRFKLVQDERTGSERRMSD